MHVMIYIYNSNVQPYTGVQALHQVSLLLCGSSYAYRFEGEIFRLSHGEVQGRSDVGISVASLGKLKGLFRMRLNRAMEIHGVHSDSSASCTPCNRFALIIAGTYMMQTCLYPPQRVWVEKSKRRDASPIFQSYSPMQIAPCDRTNLNCQVLLLAALRHVEAMFDQGL